MQSHHICHICGGSMHLKIESNEYRFKGVIVTVDDVCVFRCVNCGEEILESEEIRRIEGIILDHKIKPN